jgi:hypothetical protein
VTSGSSMYWAVFVDPPGKHIAPSTQPLPKPVILNWIGAFVPVKSPQQLFCDFGRAAYLPTLSQLRHRAERFSATGLLIQDQEGDVA